MTSTLAVLFLSVCGVSGCSAPAEYAPYVVYYAPYPFWYPRYFGPAPYSDYQVSQYGVPPAETAAIVKQRILAINAANPALLPPTKEPLPAPRPTDLPPPQK